MSGPSQAAATGPDDRVIIASTSCSSADDLDLAAGKYQLDDSMAIVSYKPDAPIVLPTAAATMAVSKAVQEPVLSKSKTKPKLEFKIKEDSDKKGAMNRKQTKQIKQQSCLYYNIKPNDNIEALNQQFSRLCINPNHDCLILTGLSSIHGQQSHHLMHSLIDAYGFEVVHQGDAISSASSARMKIKRKTFGLASINAARIEELVHHTQQHIKKTREVLKEIKEHPLLPGQPPLVAEPLNPKGPILTSSSSSIAAAGHQVFPSKDVDHKEKAALRSSWKNPTSDPRNLINRQRRHRQHQQESISKAAYLEALDDEALAEVSYDSVDFEAEDEAYFKFIEELEAAELMQISDDVDDDDDSFDVMPLFYEDSQEAQQDRDPSEPDWVIDDLFPAGQSTTKVNNPDSYAVFEDQEAEFSFEDVENLSDTMSYMFPTRQKYLQVEQQVEGEAVADAVPAQDASADAPTNTAEAPTNTAVAPDNNGPNTEAESRSSSSFGSKSSQRFRYLDRNQARTARSKALETTVRYSKGVGRGSPLKLRQQSEERRGQRRRGVWVEKK